MHFDVFNNDAFSLSQLTRAMNDLPHVPGRIGQLGLFNEEGVSTTSISIEKVGNVIRLVPAAKRGSPGLPGTEQKRNLRNLNVVHLPQQDAVIADEIQNLRAFGSETDVETLQNVVNKKLTRMKRDLDVTMEYQRIGAIKGQVLDADGTSVLIDLYSEFGVTQQTQDMDLDNSATKVKQKCIDVARKIEGELGGITNSGVRVFCSPGFFDAFVGHAAVEAAYDRYLDGQFLRESQRKNGFWFADTYFEEYRGKVGSTEFIADGEAYAVPEGVAGLFDTYFGPADYMETVNTIGLPYYARQYAFQNGKGVHLESQANPLNICTRPRAIIKLTA
jgi:hypothetical protein